MWIEKDYFTVMYFLCILRKKMCSAKSHENFSFFSNFFDTWMHYVTPENLIFLTCINSLQSLTVLVLSVPGISCGPIGSIFSSRNITPKTNIANTA